jgi:hypothetical protein
MENFRAAVYFKYCNKLIYFTTLRFSKTALAAPVIRKLKNKPEKANCRIDK